ncbi:putative Rho-type GTPase-activating protein [Podospora fimiseda]|uniref:Rho-type GTPase-activating protein n=1 Tax=Podospora fimiseda TaxID=252190 RepID=A0AAN7BVZ3_9PEZI|nr:putative Rho-type GTPase-activating protein [Podospora fimiseda]
MDDYLDSQMDAEDIFPCKGCGEILEEGKAFELAGNRWHLDCFRCNTCNTLLDSDANLLLLGDGSLICNNCTYSCSACNNKIEDLAILTGDQAFCATCFRCRNCKRKIENLRYARTSHGIFCMTCHESLMARRRKKSKAAAQAKQQREKDASPMITDKSLPALPPNAVPLNPLSSDRATPDSDTPTELSPRPRGAYGITETTSRSGTKPDRSPDRTQDSAKDSGLTLPSQSYRANRNSTILSGEFNADGEGFFIPVALDPSPAPSLTPQSMSDAFTDSGRRNKERPEYFTSKPSPAPEKRSESSASTPHIAFTEKGRQPSSDYEIPQYERPTRKLSKRNGNPKASPGIQGEERKQSANGRTPQEEEFRLQEAPKSKKLVSNRSNSVSNNSLELAAPSKPPPAPPRNREVLSPTTNIDHSSQLGPADRTTPPRVSQESRRRDEDVYRPSFDSMTSGRTDTGGIKPGQSTPRNELPIRPAVPETKLTDTYMQPRAAPPPPPVQAQTPKESSSSVNELTEPKQSPKLPRWSSGGDFSMDEDMARILGTDEGSSSILRRVSNAVRHGRHNSAETATNHGRLGHSRSVSETTRGTTSPRWPKTPIAEDPLNGGHVPDISSPISISGNNQDDPAFLKRQLRNSEQRVAELERQFNTEKDLKNLNKRLVEKRKTVSVLDTQTEIMIRQLEVLAGYVERAKKTNEPLDPRELEESAIKEFVQKLEKVKQGMTAAIELLHAERDELLEEKNQAIADRDRALLEFEQLSSKNAQLADLNNDLTHQIQERFKHQVNNGDIKIPPNGLGIYGHAKGISSQSINNLDAVSMQTGTTLLGEEEPILEGPTVVNIRKGQVKKFNWKKGSSKVAHNITKGINRAAGAFQQEQARMPNNPGLTGDSIGIPYNMTVTQIESPITAAPITGPNRAPTDNSRQGGGGGGGFGFFGKKNHPMPKSQSITNVAMPAVAESPSTLFGSELVERADYERRQIPNVVTRCIEEVELRGMDIEGIYRKTGGNSQVKMIQEGFDKNGDFDISDPDLDITAVTSVLKQYFRKLPTPLLTFDVYERILESNMIQNESERCAHMRHTINMLPAKHRDCLEFLMFHLARVASRERENLMSPKNLAVVFAPTIMRDHSLEKEMTDMHVKNLAVQFLIENSHVIFGEA